MAAWPWVLLISHNHNYHAQEPGQSLVSFKNSRDSSLLDYRPLESFVTRQ
jgi:hypothetical protein